MVVLIALMVGGILAGYALRGRAWLGRWAQRAVPVVVYVLLFALGIALGASDYVRGSLLELGGQALALAVGAVLGSMLLAKVFDLWVGGPKR